MTIAPTRSGIYVDAAPQSDDHFLIGYSMPGERGWHIEPAADGLSLQLSLRHEDGSLHSTTTIPIQQPASREAVLAAHAQAWQLVQQWECAA